MLDVGAHILKIAAHDPQDQRQRDQLIDPDNAEIGVVETELLIVERQRQQHEQRRREAERQQRKCNRLAQPELVARKGVGRRHTQQQRQHHRRARQHKAVEEIPHEGDLEIASRST